MCSVSCAIVDIKQMGHQALFLKVSGIIGFSTIDSSAMAGQGDFPGKLKPWHGGDYEFLGSGIKYKTIIFIHVQVRQA